MTTFNVGGLRLPQPFRIRRIGHFGYHVPDVDASVRFLTGQLGLIPSDVDDFTSRLPQLSKKDATGYFLRCNTDHHTLVLGSQALVDALDPVRKGALVGQISWQVGSLKEVVDGIAFMEGKVRLRRVGRDSPGSNWHVYVYDPDGYINEIYYGMEQIGWNGRSKPSSMYDRAFRSTPPLPQMPEFVEVDAAAARGDALDGYRPDNRGKATFDVEGVLLERPFKLTRLGRILLFVADMEKSLAFYTQVMGLKLTERGNVHGHECVFLRTEAEHHTLALLPKALESSMGFGAGCGLAVATYQQLRTAYHYLRTQGVRMLDVPAELSSGVAWSFWVQGPDRLAIQLYYGMQAVAGNGTVNSFPHSALPPAQWPESIAHGGAAWFDPVFMGPLA